MGRITIFAHDGCRHCHRAKAAFQERGIPYLEISLSSYPERRSDMIRLSDRLTVPQIFLNDKHIGGADETLAFLKEWDDNDQTPLKIYEEQIGSQPDPVDPGLQKPTTPAISTVKEAPPRAEADQILFPNGSKMPVLESIEQLKAILPIGKNKRGLTIHRRSFTGYDFVHTIRQKFSVKEEDAVAFGTRLLQNDSQILQPVRTEVREMLETQKALYRLQCHHTPHILNSYRVWTTRVDPDTLGLLKRLKETLNKIEADVTNQEGKVDYRRAAHHDSFPTFAEAVCELQKVDLSVLDEKSVLTFGINAYNLLIKYSFMKIGIYNNTLHILSYFNKIKFDLGGHLLSFHDLESGILRGNRNAPYTPFRQFPKGDSRLPLALTNVDCRIHCALSCGALSCPPVKWYSVEALDEELRISAQAFFEDDSNCSVNEKSRSISVSEILNWYRIDFSPSKEELPKKVLEFLRGEKKERLHQMLDRGAIKVHFKAYDWSANASDYVPFIASRLKADVISIAALF